MGPPTGPYPPGPGPPRLVRQHGRMVQPPTGTGTLVSTDIQGSTAQREHLGEDFKALLALHNTLFRTAIVSGRALGCAAPPCQADL